MMSIVVFIGCIFVNGMFIFLLVNWLLMVNKILIKDLENGRALMTAFCVLRIFVVATSFIVLVIFFVLLIDVMWLCIFFGFVLWIYELL